MVCCRYTAFSPAFTDCFFLLRDADIVAGVGPRAEARQTESGQSQSATGTKDATPAPLGPMSMRARSFAFFRVHSGNGRLLSRMRSSAAKVVGCSPNWREGGQREGHANFADDDDARARATAAPATARRRRAPCVVAASRLPRLLLANLGGITSFLHLALHLTRTGNWGIHSSPRKARISFISRVFFHPKICAAALGEDSVNDAAVGNGAAEFIAFLATVLQRALG